MIQKQEGPAVADTTEGLTTANETLNSTPALMPKWQRVLDEMERRPWGMNRFDAERIGDHCLHTTVAYIQRFGVRVDRREEVVPCRFGTTRVMRYTLNTEPENLRVARALLGKEGATV